MSAIDIYDEALAQLDRGERIGVREEVKRRAVAFAEALNEQLVAEPEAGATPEQHRDSLLAVVTEPAEELLAAALPLAEYGDADDHATIARAVQHVVDCGIADERGGRIARISAVVAVGRVVWAIATYALSARRIDALVTLAGVGTVPRHNEGSTLSLIEDRSYRYPEALGGSAGDSYRDYYNWLVARELVANRLPYLATALDTTFGEADLLLALRMQARFPGRTYSGGMRDSVVRRLAVRFRDVGQRRHLIDFFGVADGQLDATVDGAYVRLEYDRNLIAPGLPARMLRTLEGA